MAKRRSRRKASRKRAFRLPRSINRLLARLSPGAYISTALFACFLIVCFCLIPAEVPGWFQKLLGLGCACLGLAAYLQITKEPDLETDLLSRVRRGQHVDFGKQLREEKEERRHIQLPLLGQTTLRSIGAVGVFTALALWWLTPLAPVGAAQSLVPDLTEPLAAEITSLRLVFPNGQIPLPEPPMVSAEARRLAEKMPKHAGAIPRALRAIARGRFDRARQLLAEAVAEDDEESIRIYLARAWTEMYAGRFDEAVVWYRNAVIARPNDPDVLCQAAVASIHVGDYPSAMRLVLRALTEARQATEIDPVMVGVCLHNHAALNVLAGRRLDQAEVYNKKAQEAFVEELGSASLREAANLNNQSVFHALHANYPAARNLIELALRFWRLDDEKGPCVATGLANQATCRYLEGLYVPARARSDEALVIRRNTSRPRSASAAVTNMGATTIDLALGQYDDANPSHAKSQIATLEESLGSRHPSVAVAMNITAKSYAAMSLYVPAENYYLRSLRILRESLGPEHVYLVSTLLDLADARLPRKRLDDAEKACVEAENIARRLLDPKHPLLGRSLGVRGRLLLARGDADAARPLFEQALAIAEAKFPETSLRRAEALADLAETLDQSRQDERWEQAVAIYQEALGDSQVEHPGLARLYLALAKLHLGRRQHADAGKCLAKAWTIAEKSLVPFHLMLADILESEARMLREQEKPNVRRADELQRQAESIRRANAEQNRREEAGTLAQ